jgi:hypothetical protein
VSSRRTLWTRAVESAQALHDEFGIRPSSWEHHINLDPVEAIPTTGTYLDKSGQGIVKDYDAPARQSLQKQSAARANR